MYENNVFRSLLAGLSKPSEGKRALCDANGPAMAIRVLVLGDDAQTPSSRVLGSPIISNHLRTSTPVAVSAD